MKIKKIVALILTCALTISPLNSFAFAENDADLIAEVRQLKNQLNLSEADKKVLKSKIEDLIEKNGELREKIEKLLTKNKKLNDKVEKLKENLKNSNAKEYANAAIEITSKIILAVFLFYWVFPLIGSILSLLGITAWLASIFSFVH